MFFASKFILLRPYTETIRKFNLNEKIFYLRPFAFSASANRF